MRTGTFLCWLFGHKFVDYTEFYDEQNKRWKKLIHSDYCVRCGITSLIK